MSSEGESSVSCSSFYPVGKGGGQQGEMKLKACRT